MRRICRSIHVATRLSRQASAGGSSRHFLPGVCLSQAITGTLRHTSAAEACPSLHTPSDCCSSQQGALCSTGLPNLRVGSCTSASLTSTQLNANKGWLRCEHTTGASTTSLLPPACQTTILLAAAATSGLVGGSVGGRAPWAAPASSRRALATLTQVGCRAERLVPLQGALAAYTHAFYGRNPAERQATREGSMMGSRTLLLAWRGGLPNLPGRRRTLPYWERHRDLPHMSLRPTRC